LDQPLTASARAVGWLWLASALGCSAPSTQLEAHGLAPPASSNGRTSAQAFRVIELPERPAPSPRLSPTTACEPDLLERTPVYRGLLHVRRPWQICKNSSRRVTPARQSPGDRCSEYQLETERGSWALEVTFAPQAGEPATWRLIYQTEQHPTLESASGRGYALRDYPLHSSGEQVDVPEIIELFDFDGDGRSELITSTRHGSQELRSYFHLLQVWTAKGGAITAYGDTAARRLVAIVDRDADRRPEFLTDPYDLPFDGHVERLRPHASWASLLELGPSGRLLEAGFPTRAHALALCPSPRGSTAAIPHGRGPCIAAYVHCANLWQTPAPEVEQALDAFCEAERYDEQPYCPTFRESWRRLFHTRLPFTLASTP
jgi:hypothetical protein